MGFSNVTGRLHFTCFETLEGKATKSRQTSDGEEEHSVSEVPKGLKRIISVLSLESDGPGRGG